MPANALETLVSHSAPSCSAPSSSSSAFPAAATRETPQESLQQASSSRSQQRQNRVSCHGNSTTALPAVTLHLERHSKDICLPEQGHHLSFPLSSKWQKKRSEPYSRSSSSSRSSKSSSGKDGSTSTRATSLIDFAFLADKASAGAVATTTASSKSAEQSTAATAATATTAVPLTPPPPITASVAITAATTAEAPTITTKASRSKAAHAAIEILATTRVATTATLEGARNKGLVPTQGEKGVQPSRPVCMHAICCGAFSLSEESSREARSCTCFDPAAGALATSLSSHTSATNVAAVGGTAATEAEVAAESPLLRKGNHQADPDDTSQPARLGRAIIAPTEVERLGTRAVLGSAAAPTIAEEGFVSRKRQRHHHQEEQRCSPDAAAAAAAAATSCSSLQRSSSLPLLPAVSLPLLQQPRQQQRGKPCVVASERYALTVAPARPATALPPAAVAEAAFHVNAVSPQSNFSYDGAFTSSIVVAFATHEGQKVYNASAVAAEASTVAAGAAAPSLVNSSYAAQEDFNTQVAARVAATGHLQLQETNNSNALNRAAAPASASSRQTPSESNLKADRLLRSACQTSITTTSADKGLSRGDCSTLGALATPKRPGTAVAKRTGAAASEECTNVPCQVKSLSSDPKWLPLLQRLQRQAAEKSSTNVETQAHSSISSSTSNSKLAHQAECSVHKEVANRSPRTRRQQHQQQQKKLPIQIAALRRSLLQHQMKAQRQQNSKRLVSKRPNTALQPRLSYNSYCSRCRGISSRAIVKAASLERQRSGSDSVIGSSDHSASSGILRAHKSTLRAASGSTFKGESGSANSPEEGRISLPPHEAAGTRCAPVTDSPRSSTSGQSATAAPATTEAATAVTLSVTPYAEDRSKCDGGSLAAAAASAPVETAAGEADAAAAVAATTVALPANVAPATLDSASAAMTSPPAVAPNVEAAAQASLKRPENDVPLAAEAPTCKKCSRSKSSSSCCKTGHGRGVNFECRPRCPRRARCVGCQSSEQPQQRQQRQQLDGKRRRPLSSNANLLSQARNQQYQIQLSHSSSRHCHRPQSADSGSTSMKSKHFPAVASSAPTQASPAIKGKRGATAVAHARAQASAAESEDGLKMQLGCSKHARKLAQPVDDVHQQQQSRYREKVARMRQQLQEQQLLLQEEQRKNSPQRPPWNNTTSNAAGGASQVSLPPRDPIKLPAAAVEVISARLYERARQQVEIRELRRQLHQQQQQLVLLQGKNRDFPGSFPGCHSNSSNSSSRRGLAAERKNMQPIKLQHERRVLQQLHQVSLQQQQQQQAQSLEYGRNSRDSEGVMKTPVPVAGSPQNKSDKDVGAEQHHHLHAQSDSTAAILQHSALTQDERQQERERCGARFASENKAADAEKCNSSSRESSSDKNGASSISSGRKHLPLKAPNDHEQQQRERQRQQDQPKPQELHSLNVHILGLHLRLQDQLARPKKPKDRVLPDKQQQKRQHQPQLMPLRQQKQQQNYQLQQLQQQLEEERLLHQQDMRHYAQQLQQLAQQVQRLQEERLQETLHQKQLHLQKPLPCERQQPVLTPAATTPKKSVCTETADLSLPHASRSVQSAQTRQSSSLSSIGQWQVPSRGALSAASARHQLQNPFQSEGTKTGEAVTAIGKFDCRKPFYQLDSSTWSEGEFRNSACPGHSMQGFFFLNELQQQLQPSQQPQRMLASSMVDFPLEGAQQCLNSFSESERQRRGDSLSCSTSTSRRIASHLTESRLDEQQQQMQKHSGNQRLPAGDSSSLLLQLRQLYGNTNGQQQQKQQAQQEEPKGTLTLQAPSTAELRDVQERRVAALLQRHFVQQQKQQQEPQQQKPQPAKLTFGYGIKAERRSPLGSRKVPLGNSILASASAVKGDLSTGTAKELQWVAPPAAARIDSGAVTNAQTAERRRCDTSGLCSERPVMPQQQQQRHQSTQEHQPTHVIQSSSSKARRSHQALRSSSIRSSPGAAVESVQQPQQNQRLQQQQQTRQLQVEKDGRLCLSPKHSQQQQLRETSHKQQPPCPDLRPRSLLTSQQQNRRELQQQMPPFPAPMLKTQRNGLKPSQQHLLPDVTVDVPQHHQKVLHDLGVTAEQQQRLHVIHRRNIPY
ncbi:hypothetical protein Emed_005914 [Eimeria media]